MSHIVLRVIILLQMTPVEEFGEDVIFILLVILTLILELIRRAIAFVLYIISVLFVLSILLLFKNLPGCVAQFIQRLRIDSAVPVDR